MQYNCQIELIEFLNFLTNEAYSENDHNNVDNDSSTVIVTLKFFKYTASSDISNTEREGCQLLSVSFVSVEQSNYVEKLQMNTPHQNGWTRFVNFIESLNNLDLDQLYEGENIDTPLLCSIAKQSSVYNYHFFLKKYSLKSEFSRVSKLLTSAKTYNYQYFFCELERNNKLSETFINENAYSKKDFEMLEQIVSAIIKPLS